MFGNIFNQKKTQDDQSQQPGAVQQAPGTQQVSNPQQPPVADPQQQSSPSTPETPQTNQATPQEQTPGEQPDAQQPGVPGETPAVQPQQATPIGAAAQVEVSALSHLDPRTAQVLTHAQEETKRISQQSIEPEQLLLGLLYDQQLYNFLSEMKIDGGKLSKDIQAKEKMGVYKGQPTLSKTSQQAFDQGYRDAKMRGANFVTPEDLFVVLTSQPYTTAALLETYGVKKEAVVDKLSKNPNSNYAHKTVLEKYGLDLTEEARAGRLEPVAGREKEVDRIVHILLRRTKNNPIIIGETGVGKTAIVEGLAQMIVSGQIPKDLREKRIFQLDVASLVAGASHRGEFEERLRGVIAEVLGANNKIVLFIDEIHVLMGTGEGEGMNAANLIKPHLARGHFQLIGATTTTEYRKNFEKDKAFERRFQPVIAEEPSEENAVKMLKVLAPKYEKYHRVTLPDDALKECVKLSKKYIGERYLPDKAVDLLDEACSEVKLQMDAGNRADNQIKKGDIEKVVSAWTGIPITKLTEDESEKLLKLEDRIHKRLVDQEEAVGSVSEAVRRGRIGLASGQRPIASFIFLGPTGVGKTELAKTLAELLFGKDDAMARLDMSEFMEKHEVAKLIGAPPGYVGYEEGGVLTEAVRKKPYSIVLLDEIEKAHPDVFNVLLQLLEDGRLTDNKGNTISFKNTIVICTSNIGSSLIMQHLNQQDKSVHFTAEQKEKQFAELQKLIKDELTKFLRPEVLNRFDEVVIFKPLAQEHMAGIVRLGIAKTAALLKEQGYNLQITEKAVAKLAIDGYDPVYGARPLRRLVQTVIENPIALAIISKKFSAGDTIVIDYNDDINEFVFLKGGQAVAKTPLNDNQFKALLQKVVHPDTVKDAVERSRFTTAHDKVVKANTEGNQLAAAILAVTDATPAEAIQKLRKDLEEAKTKGDDMAREVLDMADSQAQQFDRATNFKKILLLLVHPELVGSTEKREQFTQLHNRLQQASSSDPLAASILALTTETPVETIQQLLSDLQKAKEEESELATDVLTFVNATVIEEAQTVLNADPVTKYKNMFKQLINPLYLAAPENKEKFTRMYDKLSEASKQNHSIATAILSITDITSDADIAQIKTNLEAAKANGDPLAVELLDLIESEIKYEGVEPLKKVLLLAVNPASATTPAEKTAYTTLQAKVSESGGKGVQWASAILTLTEAAATKDAVLAIKRQLEQAKGQNDTLAGVILEAVGGTLPDASAVSSATAPAVSPAQPNTEASSTENASPQQAVPQSASPAAQPSQSPAPVTSAEATPTPQTGPLPIDQLTPTQPTTPPIGFAQTATWQVGQNLSSVAVPTAVTPQAVANPTPVVSVQPAAPQTPQTVTIGPILQPLAPSLAPYVPPTASPTTNGIAPSGGAALQPEPGAS